MKGAGSAGKRGPRRVRTRFASLALAEAGEDLDVCGNAGLGPLANGDELVERRRAGLDAASRDFDAGTEQTELVGALDEFQRRHSRHVELDGLCDLIERLRSLIDLAVDLPLPGDQQIARIRKQVEDARALLDAT